MDFLNKTFAQFNDLFRSMTPGARITAGLLLAVVVISLGYLFSYHMSSTDTHLLGGQVFKPDEMARIQAALGANNLKCTPDGMRIKIPSGLETKYVAALSAEGALPPGWNRDSLDGASAFESPDYRKQRIKLTTEKDLGFCVSQLDEIENARVMFDKTTTSGLRKKVITSASVFAYPAGNRELSDRTVNGIRDLVSGALPPMKPEDVKIINGSTGQSYVADDGSKNGRHGNSYLNLTQDWEKEYTDKIHKLLDYIPGVRARMTVILDPTQSKAATTLTPDKKATATVLQTTKEISRDQEGAVPAGRPGFVANQPGALRANSGKGSKESETESESSSTNIVAQTHENEIMTGNTPMWMAASVVVPHSYLVGLWKQEQPTPDGEDPKEPTAAELQTIEQREVGHIQELVARMFPDNMKDVADKTTLVKVTVGRNIKPDPMPEPAMTSTAMSWLAQNWGTVGVIILAFVSLGMLRSMIKSTPLETAATQQSGAAAAAAAAAAAEMGMSGEEGGGEEGVNRQQRRLARFAAGGASLRDELTELVQEDPESAANILRTWIGTPSMKV